MFLECVLDVLETNTFCDSFKVSVVTSFVETFVAISAMILSLKIGKIASQANKIFKNIFQISCLFFFFGNQCYVILICNA